MVTLVLKVLGQSWTIFTEKNHHNQQKPWNNYSCHIKSIKETSSSEKHSLYQKWNKSNHFILISCISLPLSSKTLAFLSFQTINHVQEETNLHHFFWLTAPPKLFQLLRRSHSIYMHIPFDHHQIKKVLPQFISKRTMKKQMASNLHVSLTERTSGT